LPIEDDLTYPWSVEQQLKTGELRIPDWSAHYPLAQILWGAALFCLPFGFSFFALWVSTVVLAWLGALAFYATLQGLGRPRPDSLIATFLLLANPVFCPFHDAVASIHPYGRKARPPVVHARWRRRLDMPIFSIT
jgi:hypothetical protein